MLFTVFSTCKCPFLLVDNSTYVNSQVSMHIIIFMFVLNYVVCSRATTMKYLIKKLTSLNYCDLLIAYLSIVDLKALINVLVQP